MNGQQTSPGPGEKEIFFAALDCGTPEERAAHLARTCGGDHALRRKVEALLANHFGPDSFMAGPAVDPAPGAGKESAPAEGPGSVIGRYKLREKIGEGGCGVVYVAE